MSGSGSSAARVRAGSAVASPTLPSATQTLRRRPRRFVRSMFRTHQSEAWLDRLTETCLRTPEPAARLLLAYPVPRSFWREAVYSTDKPVLYVVRPRWTAQAENLVNKHKSAEMALFADAGHALFVDEAARFNARLADFIHRKIWP